MSLAQLIVCELILVFLLVVALWFATRPRRHGPSSDVSSPIERAELPSTEAPYQYRQAMRARVDPLVAQPKPDNFRLDAAVPNQVIFAHVFDLAVAVRHISSPIFSEPDLETVRSGPVQVAWPANKSYVNLRVHISAPDCELKNGDDATFRFYRGQDSPIFYFQLAPKIAGTISIIVTLYEKSNWLGGTRVQSIAQEQIVGSVETTTSSYTVQQTVHNSIVAMGTADPRSQTVRNLTRRLEKLQEVHALKGIDTEPHYLIEIEDIERQLCELQGPA